MLNVLEQHKLQKVLVDVRQVRGEPSTMERYTFATYLVNEMDGGSHTSLSRDTQITVLHRLSSFAAA
jgi:hypothetical protein